MSGVKAFFSSAHSFKINARAFSQSAKQSKLGLSGTLFLTPRQEISPQPSKYQEKTMSNESCGICNHNDPAPDLINPCNCVGSQVQLHFRCLRVEIEASASDKCPFCQANYRGIAIFRLRPSTPRDWFRLAPREAYGTLACPLFRAIPAGLITAAMDPVMASNLPKLVKIGVVLTSIWLDFRVIDALFDIPVSYRDWLQGHRQIIVVRCI